MSRPIITGPITHDEIRPALSSPDFDATNVILVLDLPSIFPTKESRSVPIDTALAVLDDIRLRLRAQPADYRQQLSQSLADGKTPVVKVWADGHGTRVDFFSATLEVRRR
jgi:hypothetical protein